LNNLDPSKATGPDEIAAHILKEYANEFAPLLAPFYNTSLSRGEVPSDWRQSFSTPSVLMFMCSMLG
jgi:hypothetical protein